MKSVPCRSIIRRQFGSCSIFMTRGARKRVPYEKRAERTAQTAVIYECHGFDSRRGVRSVAQWVEHRKTRRVTINKLFFGVDRIIRGNGAREVLAYPPLKNAPSLRQQQQQKDWLLRVQVPPPRSDPLRENAVLHPAAYCRLNLIFGKRATA